MEKEHKQYRLLCSNCGKIFNATRKHAKTCSSSCRVELHFRTKVGKSVKTLNVFGVAKTLSAPFNVTDNAKQFEKQERFPNKSYAVEWGSEFVLFRKDIVGFVPLDSQAFIHEEIGKYYVYYFEDYTSAKKAAEYLITDSFFGQAAGRPARYIDFFSFESPVYGPIYRVIDAHRDFFGYGI